MAKDANKLSFFDRAINLADRFFEGIDKLKKAGDDARKQNVEFLDEMNPGFKDSYEKSMQKAADLGSKFEEKAEKIIFGRDMYWGAGGEARKSEEKRRSLDEQIESASTRAAEIHSTDKSPVMETSQER